MSAGPWLDDQEQRAWRAYLAMTALLPAALDRQLQRDAELTHSSYIVLAMLSEADGRALRMSELAARAMVSPSRLSHTMVRLQERGWVRRERSAEDGRGNVATLTDEGWAVVVAAAPGHVRAVREIVFAGLSPAQVGQLARICSAVVDRLDPENTVRPAGVR